MKTEEPENFFHIEVWKENAFYFISQLSKGQILSADNIVELAEKDPEIACPPPGGTWQWPIAEAECVDKLVFTRKMGPKVNYLPINPIYRVT